jgi:O-antigen ligase
MGSNNSRIRRVPWGEFSLLLVAFWFASRADLKYSFNDAPVIPGLAEGRADDVTKAGSLLILVLWSALTLWRPRRNATAVQPLQAVPLTLYIVWSCFSILWTDDIRLTLGKLIILLLTGLVSAALAYRFSWREIALLSFLGSGLTNAIGLGAEIALGTFRPWDGLYRFAGLWHPNAHGVSLSLMVLAGLALWGSEKRYRNWIAFGTFFGFVLLLLTRSRTAVGSAVFVAICTYLLKANSTKRFVTLFGAGLSICLVSFCAVNHITVLPMGSVLLGRQDAEASTLTNRIPLWKACLPFIAEHPLVGYGYGGFWTPARITNLTAPDELAWVPNGMKHVKESSLLPDAHDLYIETTLGTGLVGAFLLSSSLLLTIGRFGFATARTKSEAYALGFSVLLWLMFEGALEAVSPQPFFPLLICPILLVKASFVRGEADPMPHIAKPEQVPGFISQLEVEHA